MSTMYGMTITFPISSPTINQAVEVFSLCCWAVKMLFNIPDSKKCWSFDGLLLSAFAIKTIYTACGNNRSVYLKCCVNAKENVINATGYSLPVEAYF